MINSIAMLATLALLASVLQTSADVLVVAYTGTVSSGYDRSGIFGAPGRHLNGDNYIARYTFDISPGRTFATAERNYAVGGDTLGITSPALNGAVTINGISHAIPSGNYYGQILAHDNGFDSEQSYRAWFKNGAGNVRTSKDNLNYVRNYDGSLPASITTPLSYDVALGDETYGFFRFWTYDYDTGVWIENTSGYVELQNLTVELASAVTKPLLRDDEFAFKDVDR